MPNLPSAPASDANTLSQQEKHIQRVDSLLSLLRWQNPVKSATILAELFLLLSLIHNDWRILHSLLQLAYVVIGLVALTEAVTKFLNGGNAGLVSSFRPSRYVVIGSAQLQAHASYIVVIAEELLYWIQRVLDVTELGVTITAFISTFIIYQITAIMPFYPLINVVVLGAFTIPAIYARFQPEIDHANDYFANIFGQKVDHVKAEINTKAASQIEFVKTTRNSVGAIFGHSDAKVVVAAPVTPAALAPVTPVKPELVNGNGKADLKPLIPTPVESVKESPAPVPEKI
ncbi:hypothetical protein D0Z00_003298 [Geotrichum galactomycetum]|uniref:Uncharacterized protein n=1 Tax=Geotrichum galactomycetum TaxID=27317 RepID=A0ACB6V1P3_9ASCO|nr:hypothetical protein D0Z00_003298 [Geotrichum candidum]